MNVDASPFILLVVLLSPPTLSLQNHRVVTPFRVVLRLQDALEGFHGRGWVLIAGEVMLRFEEEAGFRGGDILDVATTGQGDSVGS